MQPESPEPSDSLPLHLMMRIDDVCTRFEIAWRQEPPPRIEDFLVDAEGPERQALLHELLRVEQDCRRKRGQVPSAEDYLGRFPDQESLIREEVPAAPGIALAAAEGDTVTEPAGGKLSCAGSESPASERWPSVPGYEILGELGRGGMGVVYKARERETGHLVALKMMTQPDPVALARFQKECRTLQDLNHPNLVTLYNVVADGEQWFFTMELMGCSLADKLKQPGGVSRDSLVKYLTSIAEALQDAHDHGILHRDIKPGNILIDARTDEAKLTDFGLATEVVDDRSTTSAGTYLYMAPEQANGQPEKASDWYSFGIMLHEAVAGYHPFQGTPHERPWCRQQYNPAPPHPAIPGVPEDLSTLCAELLRADPAGRPSGPEVRRRLEQGAGPAPIPPPLPPPVFLGRGPQLEALATAFADAQAGGAVTVLVHGPSGVGKTALVQHFLHRLREREQRLVPLSGRCYEREKVPYKALNGLVAALGRFWRRLPRDLAKWLLPRDVGPLVRVFPVLLRVEAVADAPRYGPEAPDPRELRRQAFAGLREVLARAGHRWPLIIHLDDLQWGDIDSALMLADLTLPPDPPRLLLLAGFRSEDRDVSKFLRTFLRVRAEAGPGGSLRELPVEPLSREEGRKLATLLLGPEENTAGAAETVAGEAEGIPFIISQLVQAVRAGKRVAFKDVIANRLQGLPAEQQRLVELVAVASRPLAEGCACRAADLGEEGRKCLIELQAARLLRASADPQNVEIYHDRIREAVLARLDPATLAGHHRCLALALEVSGTADPEALATHFHGAGDKARAGPYYARAAELAAAALAFDRAASLYQLAIECRPVGVEEAGRLRTEWGHALANAGRGAEAARVYLEAARGAVPGQDLDLQRRAAEQFLRAGRIEEGLEVLRKVLGRVGMRFPATPRRALLVLLWRRLWIWWHGKKGFHEREASQIPPDELARIDVCWSAASGLGLVDPIRASSFHALHYRLALRAGEPSRVALALAVEGSQQAISGKAGQPRSEAPLRLSGELATRIGRPYPRAVVDLCSSAAALLQGRWKECCQLGARAEQVLRAECPGVAWELGLMYHFRFTALEYLGEWKQCAEELQGPLREARERGDLFTATFLLIHSALLALAADDPARSRQTLEEVSRQWPSGGFHLQHYLALVVEAEAALYAGEAGRAWEIVRGRWPALRQSMLLRDQGIRTHCHWLRARCALAAAGPPASGAPAGARVADLCRWAARDARRLEGEKTEWARAEAELTRAALALRQGKLQAAVALLEAAEASFRAADMALGAAVARRRRGQLLGGEQGRALRQSADEFIEGQGIRNPGRFAALFAPGFPEPD